MCEIAREKIKNIIEGMTLEEQEYALQWFRTELLWNETERRLKDALEYKIRTQKAMEG